MAYKYLNDNGLKAYTKKVKGALNALADSLSRILRDLGMYPELEPVPLNSEITGKYINSDGKYVDASDWNIASIGAVSLGNTYLLNMVSSANMVLGVALFVSRVYKRDKEGKIIGTTLTPLFSAKNTSIPASGYVLFEAMDDYDEVLICYKPALATQMLVARWGFKASHATQLRNLRMIVDNKTDFEGIYELLTAGYALNLVGKGNGEPQAFMSRKTGGGNITDGSAVIKEVDGVQPIVWNQLAITPKDFAVQGNSRDKFTVSILNNIVTMTATSEGSEIMSTDGYCFLMAEDKYILGHRYFVAVKVNPSVDVEYKCHLSNDSNGAAIVTLQANKWSRVSLVSTLVQTGYGKAFFGMPRNVSVGDTIQLKEFEVTDLTQMFGAGNEPTTYEEYLDRISHYYIEDAYAYNAGEVVNYKGTGIKTTNIDGTKSYVRDWSEVMKKYFPDGMTSLNGVKDFFNERKAVRKWGCKVFDGTEDWNMAGVRLQVFINNANAAAISHCASSQYSTAQGDTWDSVVNGTIGMFGSQTRIYDSVYTDISSWKAHLADLYAQGNPLVVYYELSEPVEDIFEKPLNLTYTVINGGTETSLATENSTQFEGSIFYGKDYVGVIDELQLQNRVTQIEFENWEN